MSTVTASEVDEIVIENVGPIEELHIPLPRDGGVVVLCGDNGAGKSEALDAVSSLCGNSRHKKDLEPRDGTKAGRIEGCGVKISVGRVNRANGELTVAALEDKLDLASLVDPGFDDNNSADRSRLKSLIRVAGVEAKLSLFRDLIGDVEIDAKVRNETDLIAMAGGVKRALEAKARQAETAAEAAGDEASTCLKSVEGVELTGESDEGMLQVAYRAAVSLDERIKQQVAATSRAILNSTAASKALADAEAAYTGPTVDEAGDEVATAEQAREQAEQALSVLREQLHRAESDAEASLERLEFSRQRQRLAQQHDNTIAAWREQIAQAIPLEPSEEEITAAAKAVEAAGIALQQGAVLRNAIAKKADAAEWTKKRAAFLRAAEQWRENAAAVDSILSDQIAKLNCPIQVGEDDKGLRLTYQHPRRKETYFSELSAGEKYAVVIPVAIKAVGPGGVFVLPQEAWEGLQPKVRVSIQAMLKGSRVTMLTAQCGDGPLKVQEES